MRTLGLLLLASSAVAHTGPDGGLHHGLPIIIQYLPWLKVMCISMVPSIMALAMLLKRKT